MRSDRIGRAALAAACMALLLGLGPAPAAHAADGIDLKILVARISGDAGEIDPRGKKLHKELQKEFRYESLKVVKSRDFKLGPDDVARVHGVDERVSVANFAEAVGFYRELLLVTTR